MTRGNKKIHKTFWSELIDILNAFCHLKSHVIVILVSNLYQPRTRVERYMQNYPNLQRFFWCAIMVCVFISMERLYDRYWWKLWDLQSCPQDMKRGKSSSQVPVHPSRSRLGMMAGAWQKAGHSSPLSGEGEFIFKGFVLLFCLFVLKKPTKTPMHFSTIFHAKVSSPFPNKPHCTCTASGSYSTSQAAFASGLRQKSTATLWVFLEALKSSEALIIIQRTVFPSPREQDEAPLPGSHQPGLPPACRTLQRAGSLRPPFLPEPFPAAILILLRHCLPL